MIFNLDIVMKNTTVVMDSNYPEDATVTAGQDVTFKAVITDEGHPNEYTLQWFVDGTAVPDATGETYTHSTSSDKGVLSVWCEASNKAGTATSRHATLTVKKVPVLDASYPKNVYVIIAQEGTFEVKVAESGYPYSYTYQWYVDGKAVSGATAASFSYKLPNVSNKNVYCIVTNEAGTVQSRTAILYAQYDFVMENGQLSKGFWGFSSTNANSTQGFTGDSYQLTCVGANTTSALYTSELFDCTGKHELWFYISNMYLDDFTSSGDSKNPGTLTVGVCDSYDYNFAAYSSVTPYNVAAGGTWLKVDLSNVTGQKYIKIITSRGDRAYYHVNLFVKNIYFA